MKLSIIIPVYNAAQFIEKCVKSICEQENHGFDLELILCNDGSKDNSLEILHILASQYSGITIYDNENHGVYVTRNFALTKATGDYIWLIDSDDYIFPGALNLLEAKVKNSYPEILNFGYVRENNDGTSTTVFPPKNESIIDGITFLDNNDGRLYLWNNIYKTEFIKENKLSFLAKSVSLEDSLFNLTAFSKAVKVDYLNAVLYCYCYNQNSISKERSLEHLIKLGQSSMNVHEETQKLRNSFSKSSIPYKVLNKRLEHSVLGFFFSLMKEKYPNDYIKTIFSKYRENKLLPLREKNNNYKIDLFRKMINLKWPFLMLCSIYKIMK